jgi:muconolactone delta-isomerase
MLYLVELDHVKSGQTATPETARSFIEQIIFPTLERAKQLLAEKKILAGGTVVGRVAFRFIVEADSPQELDRIITSLPLWPLAETRVTPLLAFTDRREHVAALLEKLTAKLSENPTNHETKS